MIYFGSLIGDSFRSLLMLAEVPEINEIYTFYHTSDRACAADFGAKHPGIAVTRSHAEPLAMPEYMSMEEVVRWARLAATPLVAIVDETLEDTFSDATHAIVLFTVDLPNTKYEKAFYEAAETIGSQIQFMKCGYNPGVQQAVANALGAPIEYFPLILILDYEMKTEVFPLSVRNVKAESIIAFVEEYFK